MGLTDHNSDLITTYLQGKDWKSPTEIGLSSGRSYTAASAWASPKCLKLVKQGLLERNDKGHYRLTLGFQEGKNNEV